MANVAFLGDIVIYHKNEDKRVPGIVGKVRDGGNVDLVLFNTDVDDPDTARVYDVPFATPGWSGHVFSFPGDED